MLTATFSRTLRASIAIAFVALVSSGCATQEIRENEGAMIWAVDVNQDYEKWHANAVDAVVSAYGPAREYDLGLGIYRVVPGQTIVSESDNVMRSLRLPAQRGIEGKGRLLMPVRWYFVALPAGEYALVSIVEKTRDARLDNGWQANRYTVEFAKPLARTSPDKRPEIELLPDTPRFRVEAGEVTYVGTFIANLETEGAGTEHRQLVDIRKTYELEPVLAQRLLDSMELKQPLKTVDLLTGSAEAWDIFTKPYSEYQRE